MNFKQYIDKQISWSEKTFGPGKRDAGLIDHIKKELKEIINSPGDLEEWIDVIILAIDGAWRNGFLPEEIIYCLEQKQEKNILRKWPDWKTAPEGKAIEHIKTLYKIQVGGSHYRDNFPFCQPLQFFVKNNTPFDAGNVCKYVLRHNFKGGLEDLKKAKHYIEVMAYEHYGAEI